LLLFSYAMKISVVCCSVNLMAAHMRTQDRAMFGKHRDSGHSSK